MNRVTAGRAHASAHLQATAADADMHPLSQALQEFTEMRSLRQGAIHRAVDLDPATTTL